MLLSEAYDQFLAARAVDDKAYNTIRLGKWARNALIESVGDVDLKRFDALAMDSAMRDLKEMGRTANTINSFLSNIKVFVKWCRDRGLMAPDQNPIAGRSAHKVPAKHRSRLELKDFVPLMDSCDHPRDRILIALGLFLFLRQSEAVTLKVRDVHLSEGTIDVVVHKTNEIDTMQMSSELIAEMYRWFTYYTEQVGTLNPNYYLVPAKTASNIVDGFAKLKPESMMTNASRVAKSVLENYGFDVVDEYGETTREGMHTLRRSAARAFFLEQSKSGVDQALRITMSLLHHRSVQTTERYLGLEADREARNKTLVGKPMYPSLYGDNIVDLKEVRHAAM